MNHKEIEYKYWATSLSKEEFLKRLEAYVFVKSNLDMPDCIYVVSCDDYYVREGGTDKEFVRFRKGGGLQELTVKRKEQKNVVRKEINLNVSASEEASVAEFLSLSGYNKEFQVYKEAWIWHFSACDVSYYTLSDGRSVVELEALNYNSVKDGVAIIDRWEKALSLKSLDKESRSLYEIFAEERLTKESCPVNTRPVIR
jgi:adenylate cyclase class IV